MSGRFLYKENHLLGEWFSLYKKAPRAEARGAEMLCFQLRGNAGGQAAAASTRDSKKFRQISRSHRAASGLLS